MNAIDASRTLTAQGEAIRALVESVEDIEALWRPADDVWSILEIVNHLYDEEREDFRQRIDYTLRRPDDEWPPIDPAGWVEERRYQERDLQESLAAFLRERRQSVQWLIELTEPNWNASREHPVAGRMSAGDLLASWLAHDLLHMRQIIQRRYQYSEVRDEPYESSYAGEWV